MNKEENTSCKVKVVGRDEKNRPILEFFGDVYLDTSFLYSLIMKDKMHPFCQVIWDDARSQKLTVAVSMLTIRGL